MRAGVSRLVGVGVACENVGRCLSPYRGPGHFGAMSWRCDSNFFSNIESRSSS